MSRPARSAPRERSEKWPDVASLDPAGEVARQFALNVREAIGDRTLRAAGEATGVDHSTIQAILAGNAWPDLETIAKLEIGLDADLWPGRVRAI